MITITGTGATNCEYYSPSKSLNHSLVFSSTDYCKPSITGKGVYEYIIYTLEDGEFELLDEGKIYADSEQNAKDKVLFEFAKSEEGEGYDLEDFNIQVRLF